MRPLIIGCDPGVEGAIVVLSPEDGKIQAAFNMPYNETQMPKKKKKPRAPKPDAVPPKKPKKKKPESPFTMKRMVDYPKLVELFKPYAGVLSPEVYVEKITHLFGMGPSTNFDLGYGIGTLKAAVQTVFDGFYDVPVKRWQEQIWEPQDKVFKDNGRVDTKKTTKNAFNRIFPGYKGINSDGVRDAALIAYCGYLDGRQ